MHRLSEGKLSTTMKDALIRNNIAQQKMKTALTSLDSVSKKEVNSLEYQKALYQKRRAELNRSLVVDQGGQDRITIHRGMPRSPSPRPDDRYDRSRSPNPRPEDRYDRSRSPGPRPVSGRYDRSRSTTSRTDLQPRPTSSINRKLSEPTGFTTITELNKQWRNGMGDVRTRSISLVSAPSIEISEADDDSTGVYTGVKLPPISSSPNGLKTEVLLQQRRKSTGGLPLDAGRGPRRSSLTPSSEPLTPNNAVAGRSPRSALSSTGNGIGSPGAQLPRGISRKNMSNEMRDLSGILKILDDVKQKNVPDLDRIDMRSNPSAVKKRNSMENVPMNEENVHDGVMENKMADEMTDDSREVDDLASSMDKLKFCTYLRGHDVNLDNEHNLPMELVPRTMIIGHTKMA